jgi:hypothetical protein
LTVAWVSGIAGAGESAIASGADSWDVADTSTAATAIPFRSHMIKTPSFHSG